ncbi:MAG: hypothetical protein SLAVMIC_00350 [uncultured marine phage]|uniref:Uncharacterized protein n=1 Tax=uncultured marine phage TaxID=707152 RepID=A0A8D9C8S0_9VIRU|nr:MAG: hypothetical protein SLAVMIC_00350 [uncultured marine phage]
MVEYLGWDSDYIIDKRIYFKQGVQLLVSKLVKGEFKRDKDGEIIREIITIKDSIEVLSGPTTNELIFKYKDEFFVYHDSVRILMHYRCFDKIDYRDERLGKLLDE